jgi:hypothetical protein
VAFEAEVGGDGGRVGKQIVDIPSFMVRVDSQKHIDFALKSPFGGGRPGRNKRKNARSVSLPSYLHPFRMPSFPPSFPPSFLASFLSFPPIPAACLSPFFQFASISSGAVFHTADKTYS